MPVISPIRITTPASTQRTIDGRVFMQNALADIKKKVAAGEKVVVVFDIDNTLFDSRARTAAAANEYGETNGIPKLEQLTADQAELNGKDTAKKAGISNIATINDFAKFWSGFFFQGAHYHHDTPLASSIAWANAAKAAGAEIVYLTGREQKSESFTRAQLKAAGLPDTDAKHVICKPASAKSTPEYKAAEFEKLTKSSHVAWFLTESERDISAVQKAVPSVPCVVLEYPLGEAGDHHAKAGTPRLKMDGAPK